MNSSEFWKDQWVDVLPEDLDLLVKQFSGQEMTLVSGGPMGRFEKAFAKFAGHTHGVSTCNGTAALYAGLWSLGISPGDEVLVCDYGFTAMAAVLATLGAVMVPVDMLPDTLTMDPDDLRRKVNSKCKAVLLHHPWGVPGHWEELRAACDLPFVLDGSHAHGATYQGKPVGSLADVACYSLGKGKLISGGELGCATTDDEGLRDRMIVLGHTNRSPSDLKTGFWDQNTVGLKLRPHLAGPILASPQLKRFPEKRAALLTTCGRICAMLSDHGFLVQAAPPDTERVYWRIVFQADSRRLPSASVDEIRAAMLAEGLPLDGNHYWPLLQRQSPYAWPGRRDLVRALPCPVAESMVPRLLTLPAPALLSEEQLSGIDAALERAMARLGAGKVRI